jgi:PAS domain S-box-containing protein
MSKDRIALGFVWIVFAMALLVLFGWLLDIPLLESLLRQGVPMNPVTGVLFILSAAAYLLSWQQQRTPVVIILSRLISLIILAAALVKLAGSTFGIDKGIDTLLFPGKVITGPFGRNYMAVGTAFCFTLLAVVFMMQSHSKKAKNLSQYPLFIVFMTALLALSGYLLGVRSFFRVGGMVPMALNSALCFFMLASALLLTSNFSFIRVFESRTGAGVVLRKIFPLIIILPFALGYFRLKAERLNIIESDYSVAVMLVMLVVLLSLITWYISVVLYKAEIKQRAAEKALAQSEKWFSTALYYSGDVVITTDKDGACTYMNQAAERLTGISINEIKGRNFSDVFSFCDSDTLEELQSPIMVVLSGNREPFFADNVVMRVKSTIVPVEIRATMIITDDDEMLGGLVTIRDMRKEREAEKQIKEANVFLSTIFENIPLGLFIKDGRTLSYLKVNSAVEQITGFKREQIIGKRDDQLLPGMIASYYEKYDREALRTGTLIDLEEPIVTRSQGERLLHTRKIGVKFKQSSYIIGISEDITRRRMMENKLHELNTELEGKVEERTRELQAANDELSVFFYKASHDLRNPLASLLGIINLLEQHRDPVLLEKMWPMLVSSSKRLDIILMSLLEAVQIKSSTVQAEEVQVEQLVSEVFAELEKNYSLDKMNIRMEYDKKLLLFTDKRLIRLILLRLIENSLQYQDHSKTDRFIRISIGANHKHYIISISDNGIGIAPEISSRVFEMFFRGTEGSKGSGLGLYIVRQAVLQLKGTIELISEPRIGTSIALRVPAMN